MDFFNDIFHNLALLEFYFLNIIYILLYIVFILSIFFQHSKILTRASHHWCLASNIVLVMPGVPMRCIYAGSLAAQLALVSWGTLGLIKAVQTWWSHQMETFSAFLAFCAKFMGPTWVPPWSCRPQMGPMFAPWTLLSGTLIQMGSARPQLCWKYQCPDFGLCTRGSHHLDL